MLLETKYGLGDVVWRAGYRMTKKQHACPDCLGTQTWKAISPAGTEYSFRCPRCGDRYKSNRRLSLEYSCAAPSVERLTIGQVDASTDQEKIRYMCHETGIGGGTLHSERDLYATEEEARVAAQAMAEALNAGGLPWVKQQYDATLELCGYELADAREHIEKLELSELQYRFSDLLSSLEGCDSLPEAMELVQQERER